MNPLMPAARRAEAFDALIEHASTTPSHALRGTPYADLAEVLAGLSSLAAEPVRPRAEFSADLRTRLMAAAERTLTADSPAQASTPEALAPRRGRDRRIAAALAGFAIVSASTSMAVAAQSALPGDTLYPLKRALENAHAGVQSGDGKGTTLLDSASGRLHEVDQLTRSGSDDPTVIAQTLQSFSQQADEASSVLISDYQQTGQVDALQQLRSFTATSMTVLDSLKTVVPDEARASLFAAAQTLQQIDQQALAVCPGCTGASTLPLAALTSAGVPNVLQQLVEASPAGAAPKPTPQRHRPAGSQPTDPAAPTSVPSSTPGATHEPSVPPVTSKPDQHAPDPATDPSTTLGQGIKQLTQGLHQTTTTTTGGLGGLIAGVDGAVGDLLGGGSGH